MSSEGRRRTTTPKMKRSTSSYSSSVRNSNGSGDINQLVETYNHLLDKLYPVFAVWDMVLYIIRWKDCLHTLSAILVLTILLYFPSVLASLLTLAAILVMAVGRYHGQTRARVDERKAHTSPPVELLDPNQHLLKKQHSEQVHMHKSRLEFRQILSNAELCMLKTERALDYIYNVYLWKSPEVSLCVTVLLCLVLVLLCNADLRAITASIPAIVLFTNRHFFSRTISLWKFLLKRLKDRWERKEKEALSESAATTNNIHKEIDRDKEEEAGEDREDEKDNVNSGSPEEQGSGNETTDTNTMTPELRQRRNVDTRPQTSTSIGASSVTVENHSGKSLGGGESAGGGGGGGGETDTWVQPVATTSITSSLSTRRDGKGTQHEVCSKCKTSLNLFKRKYDCSMCGQTFCGSCTIKVKKGALGVTSPDAADMTVRVCFNCKAKLDS